MSEQLYRCTNVYESLFIKSWSYCIL